MLNFFKDAIFTDRSIKDPYDIFLSFLAKLFIKLKKNTQNSVTGSEAYVEWHFLLNVYVKRYLETPNVITRFLFF